MSIGITLPYFGEKAFTDKQITADYRAINISGAADDSFEPYCALFTENGFEVSGKRIDSKTCFAVRFISSVPVVISHKKHKETYYA